MLTASSEHCTGTDRRVASGELGEDASLAQRDVVQERLAHSG